MFIRFCICGVFLVCLHETIAQPLAYTQLQGRAQGTSYIIHYGYSGKVMSAGQADSILREIDRSLSLYDTGSLICRFNRSRDGCTVDSHLIKLVGLSKQYNASSEGVFDITIKPLAALWGFGPDAGPGNPAEQDIRKVLKITGMSLLSLQGTFLRKKRPEVQIDCNGIAQGYTVDLLADFLEQRGVQHYLVELGGEIRLRGLNASGRPWTVGIEAPEEPGMPVQLAATVQPGSGAVTSSGTYRNTAMAGGKRVGHILDPTTGYPVGNGMVSVTVWAANATTADAIDNILIALGPGEIKPFLDAHPGVEAYWVFRRPDGRFAYGATQGFLKLMEQAEQQH
jgi:thiamine biosynthesis lipoprotein